MCRTCPVTDYDRPGYAAQFQTSRALVPAALRIWSKLISEAASENVARVLDLGAGTGRFWPALRRAFPEAAIIAVDISAVMLNHADRDLARVTRIVADVSNMSWKDLDSDFVFCSMLLHHLSEPEKLLERVRMALRPQGRVFIRQGVRETLDSFWFLRFFPTALEVERKRMPSEEALLQIIRLSGLTVVRSARVLTPAADTRNEYLAKVRARGFPSLQFVSDDEFLRGFDQLCCHVQVGANVPETAMLEATGVYICEATVA